MSPATSSSHTKLLVWHSPPNSAPPCAKYDAVSPPPHRGCTITVPGAGADTPRNDFLVKNKTNIYLIISNQPPAVRTLHSPHPTLLPCPLAAMPCAKHNNFHTHFGLCSLSLHLLLCCHRFSLHTSHFQKRLAPQPGARINNEPFSCMNSSQVLVGCGCRYESDTRNIKIPEPHALWAFIINGQSFHVSRTGRI